MQMMTESEDRYFHEGANCALHVVYNNQGAGTLYGDIVDSFGLNNLICACEDWDYCQMIGLADYACLNRRQFNNIRKKSECK